MASNRHEKCSYDDEQAKIVPTAKCYGLDALETVKLSTVETFRNDELPEDLWPNLSATVTRLQQLYIGSHEEKLSAREHGFDRYFWAGSASDRRSKLYRVHVKPRSSMFDPRLCATSPIPIGVEILSARPTCKKHGVAALHSSSTTLTMTIIFGQALLKGPSG